MVCDLIADPHETIDLMQSDLCFSWVIGAAMMPLIALQQSAQRRKRELRGTCENYTRIVQQMALRRHSVRDAVTLVAKQALANPRALRFGQVVDK